MRNYFGAFLVILMCGCTGIPPEHQVPHHPAPSGYEPGSRPFRFNCDSQPGKYSELNTQIFGENLWVTGFIRLAEARPGSAWPPDAGVVLAGAKQFPRIGLEAFVLPDQPDTLQIAVRGSGNAGDHTVFTTVPLSAEQMRFTLKIDNTGHLSLAVDHATTALDLGSVQLTRVNLYCSSAHVYFSDVIAGSGIVSEAPNQRLERP